MFITLNIQAILTQRLETTHNHLLILTNDADSFSTSPFLVYSVLQHHQDSLNRKSSDIPERN